MKKFVISMLSAVIGLVSMQAAWAQGDAAAGQAKSALCASCHGAEGNSEISINPKLAGQNFNYIVKQLKDYKSGNRVNATMSAMVAALTDQDILDISAWYSSQQVTLQGANLESLELGESIYRAGINGINQHQRECHRRLPAGGRGHAPSWLGVHRPWDAPENP